MDILAKLTQKEIDKLYELSLVGYNNSYSLYSNFKVGASLLTNDGKYYYGCNIENSSYGLTNCAERTTIFKAVSEGVRKGDIKALMVIGDTIEPISPCGACRQVMVEFMGGDGLVILTNLKKEFKPMLVKELLPYFFSEENLNEK